MSWRVLTHPGGPLEPHDLWSAWKVDPWLLLSLGVMGVVYAWGIWKLWRRAGLGRGISFRRAACFVGALLALAVALVSPLDALSDSLFSAHMVQHMILMLAAAPLLAIGDFGQAFLWALPRTTAQAGAYRLNRSRGLSLAWRVLSGPLIAWLVFTLVLWVWHAPVLYEAALNDETLHTFEHIVFLIAAMLFWWVLFKHTTQTHVHYGMAILYLFTTVLQTGILGALLTFASEPWYPLYEATAESWRLTAVQDQQLAGLIMWIPGGAVFTLLAIGYFAAWLRALELRSTEHRSLRVHQKLK
jgi:putative membrane protein